jgi:hypothetical protein
LASRASIDSRPWIVDSASEFRLITPSPEIPSYLRPVRVVHRRTGRFAPEVPGGNERRDLLQPRHSHRERLRKIRAGFGVMLSIVRRDVGVSVRGESGYLRETC